MHCDLLRKRREKTCKDQYFEAFDVYHSCHTVHFIVFSIRWFLSLQIFSLSQTIYCSFLWSHTLSFSISGVLYNHLAAVHVTANRTDSFYVLHFLGTDFKIGCHLNKLKINTSEVIAIDTKMCSIQKRSINFFFWPTKNLCFLFNVQYASMHAI